MLAHSLIEPLIIDQLITRFSSLKRLTLATAWLLRFKQHLIDRCRGTDLIPWHQPVSALEIQQAETELVIYVQRKCFPTWLSKLNGRKSYSAEPQLTTLQTLCPFLSNGVIRVGGRLANENMPFEAKHRAILPRKNFLTTLIIQDCHSRLVGHQGLNATLNSLMQRYWVEGPTSLIKRALKVCLFCRRQNAKLEVQIMADLSPEQLEAEEQSFTHTGVDYFGPIMVKHGRSKLKRYGCIMTCMTVRAVHLEVAPDLTTSSFINALRRFIARRGTVKYLYSDNGSNFVGAEKILRDNIKGWNQRQICEHFRKQGIQWSFNPPSASHMGGAWERMVGLIKRILGALLPRKQLSDDILQTVLLEVEAIVNSRPLPHI